MSFKRKKVFKALEARGFHVQREGSNHTILSDARGRIIALPRHKELNRYTVRGLADEAGIPWEQFRKDVS